MALYEIASSLYTIASHSGGLFFLVDLIELGDLINCILCWVGKGIVYISSI